VPVRVSDRQTRQRQLVPSPLTTLFVGEEEVME
jgi:hypothetical protein